MKFKIFCIYLLLTASIPYSVVAESTIKETHYLTSAEKYEERQAIESDPIDFAKHYDPETDGKKINLEKPEEFLKTLENYLKDSKLSEKIIKEIKKKIKEKFEDLKNCSIKYNISMTKIKDCLSCDEVREVILIMSYINGSPTPKQEIANLIKEKLEKRSDCKACFVESTCKYNLN